MQQAHHLNDGGRPLRRQSQCCREAVDEPVFIGMKPAVGGEQLKGHSQRRLPLGRGEGLNGPGDEGLTSVLTPELEQPIDQRRHLGLSHGAVGRPPVELLAQTVTLSSVELAVAAHCRQADGDEGFAGIRDWKVHGAGDAPPH